MATLIVRDSSRSVGLLPRVLKFFPLADQKRAAYVLWRAKSFAVDPQGIRTVISLPWTKILGLQLTGMGITKIYIDRDEDSNNVIEQINETNGQPRQAGFTVIDLGDAQNLPAFLSHRLTPLEDAVQAMNGFAPIVRQSAFADSSVKPRRLDLFLRTAELNQQALALEFVPLLDDVEKEAAVNRIVLSLKTFFGLKQNEGECYIALLKAFGVQDQVDVRSAIQAFREKT